MTDATTARSARFIPWLFVGGMMIVIAVNGALVYFAATTWSGIAVDRAYERGLAYNQALAAQAREEALGWTVDARLQGTAAEARLVVTAADRDGRALTDLQVETVLERPVGAADARRLSLPPIARGSYGAAVSSLEEGQWDAHISVRRAHDRLHLTRRLILQP